MLAVALRELASRPFHSWNSVLSPGHQGCIPPWNKISSSKYSTDKRLGISSSSSYSASHTVKMISLFTLYHVTIETVNQYYG